MAESKDKRPRERWEYLDSQRAQLLKNSERYAQLTTPSLFTPSGYSADTNTFSHGFNSVGSQSLNSLVNKMMLALFSTETPFFRLVPSPEVLNEFSKVNANPAQVAEALSQGEKQALQELDKTQMRPKLFEVLAHLAGLGNVLLCLDDEPRVIGLRHYVVHRNRLGKFIELIIKDEFRFDQLEHDAQAAVKGKEPDAKVCLFTWVRWDNETKSYLEEQWVDEQKLPADFDGKYADGHCPYLPLTWRLPDGNNYGVGLVQENRGDFEALEICSKAMVEGAVLASQFRWLVNPGGITNPEDFNDSPNGAAVPGQKDDIIPLNMGVANNLQTIMAIAQQYENRVKQSFLAVQIRDAERVTAEEIRIVANELETGLGGIYSRIAVDLQLPLSYYLLKKVNVKVNGKDLQPIIVTGLNALSRNGEIDRMKQFLADAAFTTQMPPEIAQRLKISNILSILAAGRSITASDIIKSDDEVNQELAAQAEAQQQAALESQAGANIVDQHTAPQPPAKSPPMQGASR